MKNGETGAGISTGAMNIDVIKKQLLQDKEFLAEIEKSMGGTSAVLHLFLVFKYSPASLDVYKRQV